MDSRQKYKAFYDGTINMLIVDKMMKIGQIFDQNQDMSDLAKAKCFTTDSMRIFTDFF